MLTFPAAFLLTWCARRAAFHLAFTVFAVVSAGRPARWAVFGARLGAGVTTE